ncbi:3-keto-5-aminohexanoate cleavage protein [Paracoccus sp. S1E-3]|uniref:3-keto-5-aminohexanoate cleavage protein n=1 Tax=Paracoccus sp. S1E-3 TaxID=2756130 RepID=UPI0015EFA525|nr:3-keto-5-aminohexanoate cleavage protein [Paracoccus sp. S1E-3]MBA4490695.1 3-keto-5-aminohexanoate cleavage protein [Paracoccus sp. S1E-3]
MSDPKPCIICVAITGSLPSRADNPAVPITLAEQIESTQEAFEAGAAIVHCHVRDADGQPTSDPDRFAALKEGIETHCPGMIVQLSTGGRLFGAYASWCAAGIGRQQLVLNDWAIAAGGHARTGLKDNVRLDRARLAPSNVALVRRTAEICARHNRPVASWQQAREILGLRAA